MDGSRLQFNSEATGQMLFENSMLRGQYLLVADCSGRFRPYSTDELALQWLANNRDVEAICERMLLWIVHTSFQQFRWTRCSVSRQMNERSREDAMEGFHSLCLERLEEVMLDSVYLILGNRCDCRAVPSLASFLFEFDDGQLRNHWKD